MPIPSLQDILRARKRIGPWVARTPLVYSPELSAASGVSIWLKLETLQPTGSFKVRGAFNRFLSLSPAERSAGVIAFSTGNHGLAVAYAAGRQAVKAVVCLSTHVPAYRVKMIESLGAEAVVHGSSQDEAEELCHRLQRERGLVPVAPFDDPDIIAGQGTIGLELLEELPGLDTVLVPVSGGGLASGIAIALKSSHPNLRIVGVSARNAPVMHESVIQGKPVLMEERDTLADSLLGGIGKDNRYTLRLVRELVDGHIVVDEEEIAAAMAFALRHHGLVVEGGGAVGIAALRARKVGQCGNNVAVVVSGRNVDLSAYLKTVQRFENDPGRWLDGHPGVE